MRVYPVLLILFLAVPLVEIYLLIKIGGVIGAWPTVALVVGTAVAGAGLLRWQGMTTLMRVRRSLERGELPAVEMLEGVLLLVAGALLLTPGFFTDAVGFLLLVPPLRHRLVLGLIKAGLLHATGGPPGGPTGGAGQQKSGPRTLEGEYWQDDDR